MNNQEVPSCTDSFSNNTSRELHSGSIPFGKSPTCQHLTNLSEIIAKQVPCQSGFLKHEANAKTFLLGIRVIVHIQLTVPYAAPTQLSQYVNPDHLKIGRLENHLCYSPALDTRSQTLSIKDRRNGSGKLVFKLAPLGGGPTCTLVAPDLSVPGISPEVLQRVLSQANRPHV